MICYNLYDKTLGNNLMKIKNVKEFDEKYIELLKLIDKGEYSLTVAGEADDGFERGISKITFNDGDNYGLLSAFTYCGADRIDLVFKNDISKKQIDSVIIQLSDVNDKCDSDNIALWCSNFNPKLVDGLKSKLKFKEDVYSAYELSYQRDKIIKDDIYPLVPVSYSEDILDDALMLLEDSFKVIALPGTFINNRSKYNAKFSKIKKSRFEAFYIEDTMVGLYFHNDAEIIYLAVSDSCQNKGYGALILKHALYAINNDSDREPYLYVVEYNIRAYNFYIREGWEITGRCVRLDIIT